MIVLLRLDGNFENLKTRNEIKGDIRTIICELLGVTHDRRDINFKIQLISPYLYPPPPSFPAKNL